MATNKTNKAPGPASPVLSNLAALILARDDGGHLDVKVPEWDCTVRIAVMTLSQKAVWSENPDKDPGFKSALLIAQCARNPVDNTPLFTVEQVPALAQKSGVVLERLVRAALKVNKLGAAEREDELKN